MATTAKPEVFADHPYPLLSTPSFHAGAEPKSNVFFDIADEMTLVHNAFIRSLNSIYLQAPHIVAADVPSFLNYVAVWSRCLHIHHDGEEAMFFPAIESVSGEEGLMEINVAQHKVFHDGLDAFETYVQACLAGRETYDGRRMVALVDAFGPALVTHLTDEIGTLVALERLGEDKVRVLIKKFADDAGESMKQMGLVSGFPFLAVNLDLQFEKGQWAAIFPPGPGQVVLSVTRSVFYYWHRDWWKFGSCYKDGTPRPLYAPGPEPAVK